MAPTTARALLRTCVFVAALAAIHGAVTLTINGAVPAVGAEVAASSVTSMVIDSGSARFSFNSRLQGSSGVVNGSELLSGATGTSFYVDAAGNNGMTPTVVRVLRLSSTLAEVALVDTTGSPLRYELRYIARDGVPGLYSFLVASAVANTSITEMRFNTRWNRCKLGRAYSAERDGSIPTGAFLDTQVVLQDSTWRIADGAVNNPALACPADNAGDVRPVYSKYDFSLYHSENPMFGHYGWDGSSNMAVGVFLTPLSGVSDGTAAASYGGGPLHQDLAVHHDSIICNYLHRNHYGTPAEAVTTGWTRLFGPWLTYLRSVRAASTSAGGVAAAQARLLDVSLAAARREIAASLPGLSWMGPHPLYPPPGARLVVTGTVQLAPADTRPADQLWVLLSPQQGAPDAYALVDATYFVRTAGDGSFRLPGIPQGTLSLYVWPAGGQMTGMGRWDGLRLNSTLSLAAGGACVSVVPGATAGDAATCSLGAVQYRPQLATTFLLSVGRTDGEGGEFALGDSPRAYDLPMQVPGTLQFTVGRDWEPTHWYYAQSTGGTWTVAFTLSRAYVGTCRMTVAASMTQRYSPTVAVNGATAGLTGAAPTGDDSTLSRQAVRSGYPRVTVITFAASMLRVGANTITFSRLCCNQGPFTGNGWDALVLEVDEAAAPPAPVLSLRGSGYLVGGGSAGWTSVRDLVVTNAAGSGPARLVVVEAVALAFANGSAVPGVTALVGGTRNVARHPVPLSEELAAGAEASFMVTITTAGVPCGAVPGGAPVLTVRVSANGRRHVVSSPAPFVCASASPTATATRTATTSPSATGSLTVVPAGVTSYCPAAGWVHPAGVAGKCYGLMSGAGVPGGWDGAQLRCASAAPGGRLATITTPAEGAFVAGSVCGATGVPAFVAVGLQDTTGVAGTNRSCCWAWATPSLLPPAADGRVALGPYAWEAASYLRSAEGQSWWHVNQPSGGTARCGQVWKAIASDVPGVDDASCTTSFSHLCCEAPLLLVSPSGTPPFVPPSASPSGSAGPTPSASGSPPTTGTGTAAATRPATTSATATAPATATRSSSGSLSGTPPPSASGSAEATVSASATGSGTGSASPSSSAAPTSTPSRSASGTGTGSTSGAPPTPPTSRSRSVVPTTSPSWSPSVPASGSPTGTKTRLIASPTRSGSPTQTAARATPSRSASRSRSRSRSRSAQRATASVTASRTKKPKL